MIPTLGAAGVLASIVRMWCCLDLDQDSTIYIYIYLIYRTDGPACSFIFLWHLMKISVVNTVRRASKQIA